MDNIDLKWEYEHRQENNLAIVEELKKYFEANPHIRFIQGLWGLNIITRDSNNRIIDRFYEEPGVTLKVVKASVNNNY